MKKKIVIFTGAGISKESGIETFRDVKDGLWNNHNLDDVCTPGGWKRDRELVLNFYNERRKQLLEVSPNDAHKALVKLEEDNDVIVITQNVDSLHEKAGSSTIIHLHGELTKARGCMFMSGKIPTDSIIDIGYNDINIGDKCKVSDSQLRPHVVFFEEYPLMVEEAYYAVSQADILLIIGTSLSISYTLTMLSQARTGDNPCRIIYIDPKPERYLNNYGLKVEYVNKPATEGVVEVVNELIS